MKSKVYLLRTKLGNKCYYRDMSKETYVRKVTRVGQRSLSVVIPAEIVDELGIRERQKLAIYRDGKQIIIEDWKDD